MYYNTHIHTFRDVDIPRRFLPLGLVRILASKPGYYLTAKLLNNMNPFSDKDQLDRYVKFVSIGKLGSQEKIFLNCRKFYPKETHFFVLSMDMEFMGAGKVLRRFTDQLKELSELKVKYPEIHPFVHIDPRRNGYMDLLKRCVEDWRFSGVKLYPPLGYFPYDEKLYPVYEYCQNNNLPVVAHCSPFNPVHFKGRKKELLDLLSVAHNPIETKGKNRKELCSQFTHPLNYEVILKDFSKLKICLAHFGSEYMWGKFLEEPDFNNNWFVIIKDLMKKYKNIYSDISFTLNNQQYFPLLKVIMSDKTLRKQILFGSDYYMVETKTGERRFGIDLRAFLGEDYFREISLENPKRFIGK